jgi:hypothetical protein
MASLLVPYRNSDALAVAAGSRQESRDPFVGSGRLSRKQSKAFLNREKQLGAVAN